MYQAALPERMVVLNPRVEAAHLVFDTVGSPISASSYVVYARQGLTTGIYINVATKDLGPLLAALTRLSPAAQVFEGGSIGRPSKSPPAPRLPSHVAVVSHFGVRLIAIDGKPPAPCDNCELTLAPGAHQFRVQYWETGFLDLGMEVTLLPGGTAIAGPALSKQPVLLVRSRGARDLTATLLPGHTYGLLAGKNLALDDWYVYLFDETAQTTVVSDRAAHCKDCVQTSKSSDAEPREEPQSATPGDDTAG